MNSHQTAMLAALAEIKTTTEILQAALSKADWDKSNEAISVMLMQGMEFFGPESPAMKQFFPVWAAIKSHIDMADQSLAMGQTAIWSSQLEEVIAVVRKG